MNVRVHLYTSTALGGILYAVTRSWQLAVSSFLSGVFIDIDHILDFLLFSDEKFSVKNLFSWCCSGRWKKITLLLHSYEIYFILIIIAYYFPSEILLGILFGAGLHMILDQARNPACENLSRWFYFLSYRIYAGFSKENIKRRQDT